MVLRVGLGLGLGGGQSGWLEQTGDAILGACVDELAKQGSKIEPASTGEGPHDLKRAGTCRGAPHGPLSPGRPSLIFC